ncbi:holo-ACP synthase [Candidatus Syntrophosphaera thermopropionivorans]|jgi:holo-[acyl-carrier protein] synthase|nr:holo-ACP synthase [Candidatus Syntrophosphaera thermopropionivorans]HPW25462.1 holo-ACP synthase [Candidatus Syntrophosphaera thermopropionivorans]HPX63764.1 holo-ACP synthase [Candidatus Syntrophosphaera thermopropionivorans]HRD00141.1 holo-ACP synthase [Candidatus Syntrophosphaera thermopropionivorans]
MAIKSGKEKQGQMIIGIGVDIVQIERVRKLVENYSEFMHQVFTAREIEFCQAKADSASSYAARFAAKEAMMKALSTGWNEKVNWLDIEVINEEQGNPILKIKGRTLRLMKKMGVYQTHLSLSHERDYALAFVVLEGEKLDNRDNDL